MSSLGFHTIYGHNGSRSNGQEFCLFYGDSESMDRTCGGMWPGIGSEETFAGTTTKFHSDRAGLMMMTMQLKLFNFSSYIIGRSCDRHSDRAGLMMMTMQLKLFNFSGYIISRSCDRHVLTLNSDPC